jgi:acetyl esterase/lipase
MTMTRKGLGAALFALTLLPAAAATIPAPADLNRTVAFPRSVVAHPDLVYAEIPGYRPLTLDLYQTPPKPKGSLRPAILFVHGGWWKAGDARHLTGFSDFPATLAVLAAKGYVVASLNYRLSGEAHFPAAIRDVKSAIRWLRAHAGDYAIDTTRVMLWGAEAGGQIAALAGTSCGVAALEPVADPGAPAASDCVQGVIDWYGPSNLASWDTDLGRAPEPGKSTDLGAYLGCEPADCAPGLVQSASPISYLESMSPPFLIQQGSADAQMPLAQSQKLYDALTARHVPADLIVYPGAGENFSKNGMPDSATRAKAIADMEDFIAKTFPPMTPAKPSSAPRASHPQDTPSPRPTNSSKAPT